MILREKTITVYVSKYDDTKEFYTESECIEYDNEQRKLLKFKEFLVDKDLLINYSPENWEHLKWWYLRLYHKHIENILRNEQMWDDIVDETTLKSEILKCIKSGLYPSNMHNIIYSRFESLPIEFYSILFDSNNIIQDPKLAEEILSRFILAKPKSIVLNEIYSLNNLTYNSLILLLDVALDDDCNISLNETDTINLNVIIQKYTSKLDNQELIEMFQNLYLKLPFMNILEYLVKQTSKRKTIWHKRNNKISNIEKFRNNLLSKSKSILDKEIIEFLISNAIRLGITSSEISVKNMVKYMTDIEIEKLIIDTSHPNYDEKYIRGTFYLKNTKHYTSVLEKFEKLVEYYNDEGLLVKRTNNISEYSNNLCKLRIEKTDTDIEKFIKCGVYLHDFPSTLYLEKYEIIDFEESVLTVRNLTDYEKIYPIVLKKKV